MSFQILHTSNVQFCSSPIGETPLLFDDTHHLSYTGHFRLFSLACRIPILSHIRKTPLSATSVWDIPALQYTAPFFPEMNLTNTSTLLSMSYIALISACIGD